MINVVLTGGRTGLGRAFVDELDKAGVITTIIGRQAPYGLDNKFEFVELDLSGDISEWRYDIKKNVSEIVFISNAGSIDPICQTSEISISALQKSFNINFASPLLIASELSKKTEKLNLSLQIANISTGAALRAVPTWASYCSSKAAARVALDCLALENEHVKVEHIDPGLVNTGMQQKIAATESVNSFHLGRSRLMNEPQEVARRILMTVLEG